MDTGDAAPSAVEVASEGPSLAATTQLPSCSPPITRSGLLHARPQGCDETHCTLTHAHRRTPRAQTHAPNTLDNSWGGSSR